MEWRDIPLGSPILILNIGFLRIDFLYQESVFSIHDYCADFNGCPAWCEILTCNSNIG